MTVIDLEGVTRIYHVGDIEVQALAGVDLRVESGEFLALMGASGSGKSTMLNILGCLDRPSSGRYRFEGVDVAERSEPELARIRSERIGFVFQSFNLLARTTAVEKCSATPLLCRQWSCELLGAQGARLEDACCTRPRRARAKHS